MTREALYGFIAAEKTTYPVRLLCRTLQVSASAFYDWLRAAAAPQSATTTSTTPTLPTSSTMPGPSTAAATAPVD